MKFKKALYKTISWKILSTSAIFLILLALGVDLGFASEIAAIDFFARAILYYGHELVWHKWESKC